MRLARVALVLVTVLVAGYGAVCALVYAWQDRLIYFPQATRIDPAATDWALQREDGIVLRGWRRHPGASKVLLYFGGNGEDLRDFPMYCQRLSFMPDVAEHEAVAEVFLPLK